MKNTLFGSVFIKRVEHILTYNKHVDGSLFPSLFEDHNTPCYIAYKRRADLKQIEFSLTKEDYLLITANDCYICGKPNTTSHVNGVDRYDNNIGYVPVNCRSCCGDCNYTKRGYSYDELFDKFNLIYQYNLQRANITMTIIPEPVVTSDTMLLRGNKKTPEQIREASRLRKQKQRAELQAKYGDEEYKKNHAKQIAEARLKRKQQTN
jgi:hypothetical protein